MTDSRLTCMWRTVVVGLGLVLALGLVLVWTGRAVGQAPAPADPLDQQRTGRYVAELTALEEARMALRERAATLVAQTPELEQELQNWLATSMVAAGAIQTTPAVITVPTLLQTYRVYRGQSGEIYLSPQLLLWYMFQDNTLVRQHLLMSLASAQRSALQTYAAIQSSRVAIEQIAGEADQNFLEFLHLGDTMGRRSALELAEAESLTAGRLARDPLDAGAGLVRAHALRSLGRFDECQKLLDQLDDNLPAMQAIRLAIAGQIAYLAGNTDEAKRALDKGVALARDSGVGQPHLIYGWLQLADGDWPRAKSHASRLRALAPNDVETAILEALAQVYDRPNRARDSLQILRRVQLNASPDDWHYHEALAIVHAFARDRQFARRQIAQAIAVAPSHVRAELEREQQEIDNAQVPTIDWHARLAMQWQTVK